MTRRDYLKRIGLTTAAAIGSNHLGSLHTIAAPSSRNHDSSASNANPIQATLGQWPQGSKPNPAVFGVKLIFAGMCLFGYKGKEARVVFHRGHTQTHKMKIIVAEKGTRCTDIFLISDASQPADIRTIELGIEGKSSNANFFLGSEFNRAEDKGDELDFRWLIDLEGPDGYHREIDKHDRIFKAKMKVKHGTFYTYQRTFAKFKAQGGPFSGRPLGRIAKVMGANIARLNDGESVYLNINDVNVLPYPLTNRAQYEIYFFNEPETTTTGDFHMVFDAFDIDAGEKFNLLRDTPGREVPLTGLCHNLPYQKEATDEAPCMGGGFGSGKGFP